MERPKIKKDCLGKWDFSQFIEETTDYAVKNGYDKSYVLNCVMLELGWKDISLTYDYVSRMIYPVYKYKKQAWDIATGKIQNTV